MMTKNLKPNNNNKHMNTTKPSLFGSAKAAAPKSTKKDKPEIQVSDSSIPQFSEKLNSFIQGNLLLKDTEAQVKALHSEVLEIAKNEYLKNIKEGKRNIGSFKLVSDTGEAVLILPMDKYSQIDAERFATVKGTYPNLVTEKQEYSFNPEVLERNMEVLERIIMNCEQISDYDKANLLTVKTSYVVNKGAIDIIPTLPNPEQALYDLNPQFQIRNV